mmetsp:Transcript_21999/g.26454  ORF Transcript_21999/g.26454 Transcript_21999/m.26454 type:complete len:155 (+) Transcript_21999:69-533(+)
MSYHRTNQSSNVLPQVDGTLENILMLKFLITSLSTLFQLSMKPFKILYTFSSSLSTSILDHKGDEGGHVSSIDPDCAHIPQPHCCAASAMHRLKCHFLNVNRHSALCPSQQQAKTGHEDQIRAERHLKCVIVNHDVLRCICTPSGGGPPLVGSL